MSPAPPLLPEQDRVLLHRLRNRKREPSPAAEPRLTTGQLIADKVAAAMGSWPFIIIQTSVLVVWMMMNVTAFVRHWDPYPFILLNLALSFQAAYAAPFIMMSQNRQAAIDRADARHDYDVNVRAELEIKLLHEKVDQLRELERSRLIEIIERLEARLS
ncbi:DUF1003 domain-containing protein [Rhizosaccharibacter radicis]|uniref:DUF1003 domain-containing protein n=1 Tax=Rhizosaccharibacter radicis TaxID=2782605 RepID=A0ABT1W0M1_9PROT|nr:DUF1003 domain-containing protein [Acetobacteraceae bacterium KSS12]